jgi:hypothetical protein
MEFYSLASPPPRVVSKIVGRAADNKAAGAPLTGGKRAALGQIPADVANSSTFRSPLILNKKAMPADVLPVCWSAQTFLLKKSTSVRVALTDIFSTAGHPH